MGGKHIRAYFGVFGGDESTAVIETAAASGIGLVPAGRLNPLRATTFGTGQLIRAALDEGVDTIIVGLGGSATIDAGVGMLQALGGVSFKDHRGRELGYGGQELISLSHIDVCNMDERLKR